MNRILPVFPTLLFRFRWLLLRDRADIIVIEQPDELGQINISDPRFSVDEQRVLVVAGD